MLNSGAYSTKYQQLERDRLRQLRNQRQSNDASKAQLYSKQTAKRQKALEDRKRAMAVAEEERRRKALEERRKAQREATNRFKTAMSKMRTAKTPATSAVHRNENLREEMYLPDKPRPPVSVQRAVAAERVTLGSEVEVTQRGGAQGSGGVPLRTPSLDDVLTSVRGETKSSSSIGSEKSARDVYRQQPMPSRSVSDTSLNLAHQERVSRGGGGGKIIMQAAHSLSRVVTSDSSEVNRDVVFCPVMRSPLPRATNGDDMRVVSPELPDSLSSESPSDRAGSTSPPFLDDSLDGEATPPALKQATRKKRGDRVRSNQPQPVYIPQTASPSLIVTGLHANGRHGEDSDSSTDSLDYPIQYHSQPPRSRREHKRSKDTSTDGSTGKAEPKIVGILKRNGLTPYPSASTTAQSSQVISTAVSSILADSKSAANVSQLAELSKSSKKVRFMDQIISPVGTLKDGGQIDKARQAIWSKVLPNGIATNFPPNSAFTPKLRVTLSGNGVPKSHHHHHHHHTPPNGITVHVPRAVEVSPPPSPVLLPVKQVASPSSNSAPSSGVHSESTTQKEEEISRGGEVAVLDGVSSEEPDGGGLVVALDKTPTDDDINELWGQIRKCLNDDRKVSVPPRVFNFRTLPQQNTTTLAARSETRPPVAQLTATSYRMDCPRAGSPSSRHKPVSGSHRGEPSKPRAARSHGQLHQQPPVQLWRRHNLTYPHASSHEPAATRSRTGGGGGGAKLSSTALSLEEQRLMHSIEKLNQRLKNHLNYSPEYVSQVTSEPPTKRGQPRARRKEPVASKTSPNTQTHTSRAYTTSGGRYRQHY